MKTILVTGGNRGIGLEICRQLDVPGHRVILCSRSLQKGLDAAAGMSDNVVVKQLDVTDETSIDLLVAFITDTYGQLDVLINNAALGSRHFNGSTSTLASYKDALKERVPGVKALIKLIKPLLRDSGLIDKQNRPSRVPLDEVRLMMETNLYGPWAIAQAFIPLLHKSGKGRVINISSGYGALGSLDKDYPAYRMTKASLNALSIMLAKEFEQNNIKVNAMCPGWVRTDMGGPDAPRSVEEGADTAVWLATEEKIPAGKFFRNREIIPW